MFWFYIALACVTTAAAASVLATLIYYRRTMTPGTSKHGIFLIGFSLILCAAELLLAIHYWR